MSSPPKIDQLLISTPQAVSLDDQVNALSLIYHPGKYKQLGHHTPAQLLYNKHPGMRLLDRLTLLLVTRDSHDVGAISLIRSPQKVAIYYAKNEPCNEQEREYINGILKRALAATDEPAKSLCRTDILRSVILNCGIKINKRLIKIYHRLNTLHKSLGHYRIVVDPYTMDVEVSLRKLIPEYFFPKNETMKQFFTRIFDGIRINMEKPAPGENNLGTLIRLSWAIAMTPNVHLILDEVLLHRIRKLGDYELAIRMLVNEISELKRCGKYSVTIEEILPPESLDVYVSIHPATVLNAWARSRSTKIVVSQNLLSSIFPQMKSPAPNPRSSTEQKQITTSVHCECTLAVYLLKKYWSNNHQKGRSLKIQLGVSKPSCFMCQVFLDGLMKENPDVAIIITVFNSKMIAGWRSPEASPLVTEGIVHERVSKLMDDVLEKTLRKHRLDLKQRSMLTKTTSFVDRKNLMGMYALADWRVPTER